VAKTPKIIHRATPLDDLRPFRCQLSARSSLAHKKLDAAVATAYGWPVDLSDEEILARLLALNLERAGA
jgi:hypothetical protein